MEFMVTLPPLQRRILDCIGTEPTRLDLQDLAARLGTTKHEVATGLRALVRLGWVEWNTSTGFARTRSTDTGGRHAPPPQAHK